MPIKTNRGDIARSLAQRFGVKGIYPMSLDEVTVPVVLVGDMRELTEDPETPGADQRAVGILLQVVDGIGGEPAIQLQNRADSRRLIKLDRIFAAAEGFDSWRALTLRFITEADFLPAFATESRWWRDTRLGSAVNPDSQAGRLGSTDGATPPLSDQIAYLWAVQAVGGVQGPTFEVGELGIILRPGTGVEVQLQESGAVSALGITFEWRETGL